MKTIPIFEAFSAAAIGGIASVLMLYDIFGQSDNFYNVMSSVMPEYLWTLLAIIAFLSHVIGLTRDIHFFRYVGLTGSGIFFSFLFFVNTIGFPNLMTTTMGATALFCFMSLLLVRSTDIRPDGDEIELKEEI